MDDKVKILIRFHSDIFDEIMVETLWADIVDREKGLYKLDNIPFYAPLIASDDIVYADYDDSEQMLTYRNTVEYSGNSVVQIVIMDSSKTEINKIRDIFTDLGCVSEKVNAGYFSMEIPYSLNYKPINDRLQNLESDKILEYSEPCLSDKHKKDITN